MARTLSSRPASFLKDRLSRSLVRSSLLLRRHFSFMSRLLWVRRRCRCAVALWEAARPG